MKLETLIEKGLSEEQAKEVLALHESELGEYVLKSELDNANSEIEKLKETVGARDAQIADIKKNVGDNEELKNQITALQNDNKNAADKYKAEIEALKINNAVDMALTKSGAKTLKACKALLNMEGIKLDKDGNITGLNEQLKTLTESDDTKYLFDSNKFVGVQIGKSESEPTPTPNLDKMNYTELCAYMEANPNAQI